MTTNQSLRARHPSRYGWQAILAKSHIPSLHESKVVSEGWRVRRSRAQITLRAIASGIKQREKISK